MTTNDIEKLTADAAEGLHVWVDNKGFQLKPVWTKEYIAHKLETDYEWLERGIKALYKNQTVEERKKGYTFVYNKSGFNGVDAPFLSSLAYQIEHGYRLTGKQVIIARKMMKKYAGQLAQIANSKREAA